MSDRNKLEELKADDWETVESDSEKIVNKTEIKDESEQFVENNEDAEEEIKSKRNKRRFVTWIVALTVVGIAAFIAVFVIWSNRNTQNTDTVESSIETNQDTSDAEISNEVKLTPELLLSAGIEIESVTSRPAVALLNVPGTIESNPQQTQKITSLVGGRVVKVFVSIGDRVKAGQTVATLMSTEIAESYGKWREAQTRVKLAQKNLNRIKKVENRVKILQAKAKLDEARATLKRVRRLIELEAGAGKDLISAQTNYKTAKAEYDFQRNIPLNKEFTQAEAELEIARVDATHLKQSLESLGVSVKDLNTNLRTVAQISIRSPSFKPDKTRWYPWTTPPVSNSRTSNTPATRSLGINTTVFSPIL